MHIPVALNRHLVNFGTPISLLGVLFLFMHSSVLVGNETLSFAIIVDLVLTVPLVYFLLVRRSEIPNTTAIPVMVVGILLGSYFLPKESQIYLTLFKTWALPVIELAILAIVIIKVRGALMTYRGLKGSTDDIYDALKQTCFKLLPKKLVLPFATEVAVFYYGFIHWKRRTYATNEFTYHKNTGTPALLGAFILVIGIETIALHFLLATWSPLVAWILTGLSGNTAIQILGFAKALPKRPIALANKNLILRYGIMNESRIPYLAVESVSVTKLPLVKGDLTKTLSPLGALEGHNVVIHLNRAQVLIGPYGFRKEFTVIGLHVDAPVEFKKALEVLLN